MPNRSVVVRPEERPAAIWRMARFRFARGAKSAEMLGRQARNDADGESARDQQRGGADNSVSRLHGTKVAKANDADDQPADCQATAPAQGAQHCAGA